MMALHPLVHVVTHIIHTDTRRRDETERNSCTYCDDYRTHGNTTRTTRTRKVTKNEALIFGHCAVRNFKKQVIFEKLTAVQLVKRLPIIHEH
jgi:hypothetical protein